MTCQDFQNEFEERAGLSDAANLHLKDCADCEKLHRRQSQIWQMIETLPEVAAPADFNQKFRARLARSKASDFRPAWWKSLRYVAPVFAAVLVLTMVFASQNFFVSTPTTQELAVVTKDEKPTDLINNDVKADTVDAEVIPANYNASEKEISSTPKVGQTSAPSVPPENRNIGNKEIVLEKDDDFVGVKDFGVNPVSPPLSPKGIPQIEPKTAPSPGEMSNSNEQNIDSYLSFSGAEFTMENGKRRVNSVQANSSAARSGLKNGDLIETVNLSKTSDTVSGINIKSLTILRGNTRLVIPFRIQ